MPRIRPLEGREAGLVARAVQLVFRRVLGRELNPYKVEAHAPRAVLASFLSNAILGTGRWRIGAPLRHLVRVRAAALNGCAF